MIWQCITGILHNTMSLPPNHNTSTAVTTPSQTVSTQQNAFTVVVSVMGVVIVLIGLVTAMNTILILIMKWRQRRTKNNNG